MATVFVAVAAAAILANAAGGDAKQRLAHLLLIDQHDREERDRQIFKVRQLEQAMAPVREFAEAWRGIALASEKDAAERMRAEIEAIAQRQLGLVTDNAITPQPDRYSFRGTTMRVQRVTLRASGKDLSALLAWLGKVEEKYPAAFVESCDFSSNVGGSTGLTIRLVQPLTDSSVRRLAANPATAAATLSPEQITEVHWVQYLPMRIKTAVPVGFQRNPLQPAVAADPRSLGVAPNDADEITVRLATALDGHIRSVIRGASPLIVIDGRVFRVGDELVLESGRERPIPGAKAKLKHVGDERLIFHVFGGGAEKSIECDAAYVLPAFLQAR